MIKRTITFMFIAFLSTSAFAQLSVGAQFSRMSFLAGSEVKNNGFGLLGSYGLSNGIVAYGGFNYYLPYEAEGTYLANASSNQTSPSTVDVKFTQKIPVFHLYAGAKKYFVGDYDDENFGFYAMGEAGFMIANVSTDVGSYDQTLYNLTVSEDEAASNFMIGLGAGVEKGFDFGYIFLDAKLQLAANEENGVAVEVEIPASFMLNVGYRVMF